MHATDHCQCSVQFELARLPSQLTDTAVCTAVCTACIDLARLLTNMVRLKDLFGGDVGLVALVSLLHKLLLMLGQLGLIWAL